MAINVVFNGANIYRPGYYGDPSPRAQWFNNCDRRDLLQLLRKLNIRSASLYGFP